MHNVVRIVLILLLIFRSDIIYGANFFGDRERGWHWYETMKKADDKIEQEEDNIDPTEQLEVIQKEVKRKLHKALINPSISNVSEYMKMQAIISRKSQLFSDSWQKAIYLNPMLDRTIKNPVNYHGVHLQRELDIKKRKKALKLLSREYGLMYFFSNNCIYCKKFSPVVKSFTKTYGWDVMPIQIGAGISKNFPGAEKDNGIAAKFGIKTLPALIAVHPKTKRIIPLAFGYRAMDEIEERAFVLTRMPEDILSNQRGFE